ncbi:PiggyBac transposable element-derived protein 1 [Eumeta japonica]|uniref:PiggyBac transposable element-derived protein 1 n=1 Tax=Eumeta variegata TaxID=151549 RepID=A0A4C1VDB1_EUMVA|nr:PiggyBac transposable element-derived protein 1 [Eumeta japonica]
MCLLTEWIQLAFMEDFSMLMSYRVMDRKAMMNVIPVLTVNMFVQVDFAFTKKSLIIPETDSDSSDEEVAPAPLPPKNKKTKQKQVKPAKVDWVPGKLDNFDINNYIFTGNIELPDYIENLEEPAEFFKFLFTDELIRTIIDQSNLKSVQDNINRFANITKDEMEQFIGIVFLVSIVKLPAAHSYWNISIGQAQVYEIMTCNRFEVIKQNLHFNDNNRFIPKGQADHDKLFKVHSLLEESNYCLYLKKNLWL